jgi:16S rRNA (cytosine1402-N4)-methyltransferase
MNDSAHISVMADEVVDWMRPRPGGRYLDGTLGLGGHCLRMFEKTDGNIEILAFDKDIEAIDAASSRLLPYGDHLFTVHGSFRDFEHPMKQLGWKGFDGVLLDLGISSMQIDQPDRGFSFVHDGPLDMRMDKNSGRPGAKELLARLPAQKLRDIIWEYGEEPMAGRIARAIVSYRESEPIVTTLQLAEIVSRAYPPKRRALSRNHPATKTFQAIRIAVNRELDDLQYFLERIPDYLVPGARIVVISFHSLEDRIVKRIFRTESKGCLCPRHQPVCVCGHEQRLKVLTKKPLVPSKDEMAHNPRSRSAKLRVAERVIAARRGTP